MREPLVDGLGEARQLEFLGRLPVRTAASRDDDGDRAHLREHLLQGLPLLNVAHGGHSDVGLSTVGQEATAWGMRSSIGRMCGGYDPWR
jgi:hypothetical protein